VLDYNATLHIEDEAFYVFLDIDKTRLLKMSHGQTMSLLAGQRSGIRHPSVRPSQLFRPANGYARAGGAGAGED